MMSLEFTGTSWRSAIVVLSLDGSDRNETLCSLSGQCLNSRRLKVERDRDGHTPNFRSADERFKSINTTWHFWLVGDDVHSFVEREPITSIRPGALPRSDGKFTITVRGWSEVIDEACARLQFVEKELITKSIATTRFERRGARYAHPLGGEDVSGSDTVDALARTMTSTSQAG
jgi:hypothetical protein